jgi:hypothetical protein
MSLVEYYWRCNGPLWKIFWIYGVAVSVGLATLIATAAFQKWVGLPGLIAMLVGLVIYTIWVLSAFGAAPTTFRGIPSARPSLVEFAVASAYRGVGHQCPRPLNATPWDDHVPSAMT